MPDLLSLLKLANIFSPTGQMTPQQFPIGGVGGPPIPNDPMMNAQPQTPNLMESIQKLLSPRDEQFQNFNQLIGSMPQRSQYEPSKFRKIAAAIAGMGTATPSAYSHGAALGFNANVPEGLKVQKAINEEPYAKALSDWSNKLDPAGKATSLEQQRNVGDRATALGVLQKQQAQEKLDEAERKNRAAEEDKDLDRSIREMRAEVYKYKAEHPNSVFKEDKDGNIIAIDPSSTKAIYVTDPSGNKIKSSKLPDADRINLQLKNELTKIDARGDQAKETEGYRQANRKELEGVKQINRVGLKETSAPARPVSEKALTPSAQNTAKVNKAIEIINEHPELKPYFVYGGNKKPTGELVVDPKKGEDAGFAIAQRLMGKSEDIKLPSGNTSAVKPELTRFNNAVEPPQLVAAKKKLEAGYVLITRDGGKTFSQIPAGNVNKLKPESGWVVVK